jgi:TonB-dependent receptor
MLHLKTKRKIMSVAVAGACGWMILPAYAQQASAQPTADKKDSADAKPATPAVQVQKAEVTGFRAAAEDALNIKKNADGFVDAISTDGLGRFPELNVGEALTRIPGIQLDRTQDDRNARVSLRGLPGGYTITTVNGLNFADPGPSVNGSPMGTFLSDVFNTIVVNKSPGASEASGGLAGNIDLQFRGALASKDGGSIKVAGEYNTLGKSKSPSATLKYAKHLTPDFAVFVNLAVKREYFRRDTITQGTPIPLFESSVVSASNPTLPTGLLRDPLYPTDPNKTLMSYEYFRAGPISTASATPNRYYVKNIADFADYYGAPLDADPTAKRMSIPVTNSLIGNTVDIVGNGSKSNQGVFIPGNPSQQTRETKGETRSFSAGFGYKFNKKLTLDLAILSADKNLKEASSNGESVAIGTLGGPRVYVDPSTIYKTPSGKYFANDYTFENAQLNVDDRGVDTRRNKTSAITASTTWNNGIWSVISTASFSKAQAVSNNVTVRSQYNSQQTYRAVNGSSTDAYGVPYPAIPDNGLSGSVSGGLGDVSKFKFTLSPSNPLYVPTTSLNINEPSSTKPIAVANPNSIRSNIDASGRAGPGNMFVTLTGEYAVTGNRVSAFQQVFERQLTDVPIFESFKFGYQVERNKFKSFSQPIGLVGVPLEGVSSPGLFSGTQKNIDSYFGGAAPGYNRNWQVSNYDYVLSKLKPTAESLVPGNQSVIPGVTYTTSASTFSPINNTAPLQTTALGFVVNPNVISNMNRNFENNYQIFGSYVEGQINTKLFGYNVKGRIGLRHENTDKDIYYNTPKLVNDNSANAKYVLTKDTVHNNYSYNLPSLLLRTSLSRTLQLRYAAYQTYTRPSRTITPIVTVTRAEQEKQTNITIDNLGGNSIVPYTGISQDVGIEWYNRSGSVVALSFYQKMTKGEIYSIDPKVNRDLACPADGLFNGVDYGTGRLDSTRLATEGLCQAAEPDFANTQAGGAPVPISVRVTNYSLNNPNPFKVRGVEFNVQQNLNFLPAPWKYIGGSFNASSNITSGKYPNGRGVRLLGTSKINYNVQVYFDQGAFSTRLVLNKRGSAPISADSAYGDVILKPRAQVDLSSSWKFKSGALVSFDVSNLTNALVQQYQDDTRLIRSVAYDGRTAVVSTRIPF